jgi:trimeric autotransporter adhesin
MNNVCLKVTRSIIFSAACCYVNPLFADLEQELHEIEKASDDRSVVKRMAPTITRNTSYGNNALGSNVSGTDNSAFGTGALQQNTTGLKNTAIGRGALHYNTTGKHNVAVGSWAIGVNTTGHTNIGLGDHALSHNTTGRSNAAVGNYSLGKNTTGQGNTAVGIATLYSGKTGIQNTAVGYGAMHKNSGLENTVLGAQALFHNRNGDSNTILGAEAGLNNIQGSSNIFIGFRAGYNEKGSNKLIISNSEKRKPFLYGDLKRKTLKINADVYAVKFNTNSDIRLKEDIKPLENTLNDLSKLEGKKYRNKQTETPLLEIGLIAQEVERVFPEVVSETNNGYKAIAYDGLIAILIEAIKEQQEVIEKQGSEALRLIREQQQEIARLQEEYDRLATMFKRSSSQRYARGYGSGTINWSLE